MDVYEAAQRLKDMVRWGDSDPRRRRTAMVQLFGITYVDELEQLPLREVVELADLTRAWETTIKDAMNLSEYVEPREECNE